MKRIRPNARCGFTLIEILLAAVAAALVLTAVYGIFRQAMRIRDSATQRTRDSRVRLRAEKIIRGDLRNALVSGGLLATVCAGDSSTSDQQLASSNSGTPHSTPSHIPGYLRFTTTTGRNDAANGLYGDVQQVEYYVAQDPASTDQNASGMLVRAVTRDLLDAGGTSSSTSTSSTSSGAIGVSPAPTSSETTVLGRVASFQVAFFDGSNWQTSWQFSDLTDRISPAASAATSSTSSTSSGSSSSTTSGTQIITGQTSLPDAVRLDIQQAPATPGGPSPAPLEILVPWTTQPFVAATPANSGSATQ